MVEIRKIDEPVAVLYKKTDNGSIRIGEVDNYLTWLDVRVQIKEANESGYYFMCGDKKVTIDNEGQQDIFPEGWFDEFPINCLLHLI